MEMTLQQFLIQPKNKKEKENVVLFLFYLEI